MVSLSGVIVLAIILRIGFFLFGLYQDEYMPVKYTDIDYLVFSDASHYVFQGQSPYLRETYRYTPILAMMLLPNNWGPIWYSFGKVSFMIGDLVTGVLIAKLLSREKNLIMTESKSKRLILSSLWLLNPMVITISTRGSSESILTVLIMLSLYCLIKSKNVLASAFWLGLAIHFKIYPIIYIPSIMLYLTNSSQPIVNYPVIKLVNVPNLKYAVYTVVTLAMFNTLMYFVYGQEFLDHSYLYHVTRIDHRHNFSVYNMVLYYKSALPASSNIDIETLAFIPQLLLAGIIIPLIFAKQDLLSCLFLQTFTFVTFNKVITSQYFIWFLIFLPHFLFKSDLLQTRRINGVFVLLLWVISQGCWLYNAYRLEFLGENTFDYSLFNSSLFFFLSNCICIGEFIKSL